MRKSRFSEEQIIGLLKQAEAGRPVAELCRQVGITDTTFYKWRNKFAGLEVSEARPHSSLGGLAPEEYGKAMNEENQKGQRPKLRLVYSAG